MSKSVVTTIFSSPEEEELFAKCAREAMSEKKLTWDDEEDKHYKCVVVSIFSSPEEEALFYRCCRDAMSQNVRLTH